LAWTGYPKSFSRSRAAKAAKSHERPRPRNRESARPARRQGQDGREERKTNEKANWLHLHQRHQLVFALARGRERDAQAALQDPRVAHGYVRTALEVDGQLGGPSELHLHQHHSLPPAAQKLLEEKFLELFGNPMQAKKQEEQALTISGATAPEVHIPGTRRET